MARVLKQRVTWRLLGLVSSETALIVVAVIASADMMGVRVSPGASAAAAKALLMAVVCQLSLYYAELYESQVLSDQRELAVRLMRALGSASLILAALYFWIPSLNVGRGVFALSALVVFTAVIAWRMVFKWMTDAFGVSERLLLVGTGPATVSLARELHTRRELGVDIVGFIDPDPARIGQPVLNPGVIGTIEHIPQIVSSHRVDRVVVSLAEERGCLPMDRLLEMKLAGVAFDHLASVYEEYTGKIAIENLRPSWLIFSAGFRKSIGYHRVKRAIDIVGSAIGLVCSAPLILLSALAVTITSRGPVLFAQTRVGQNGRVFTLYKIRSMCADAEALTGAVWARDGDPRVTRVGRVLRKTRLDELPQFWNVLRGDMSLIGPRPERPEFVSGLTREIPYYGQRHAVKPGITGWAQVRYAYGASVEDALEKLQYDLFYVKNLSIALDAFIMLKTIQTIVLQRGT